MNRGGHKLLFSNKVGCCKRFLNRLVTILFSNGEGMTVTSTVVRRPKGSASKVQVPCPNVIKMYKQRMGGVNLVDQRIASYSLDCKSLVRIYLHIF